METGKDQTQIDFEAARRRAFWNEVGSFLTGRPNRLLSWEEVRDRLDLRELVHHGVEAVPLEKIFGGAGRYQDFDRAFMPRRDNVASRWRLVDQAHYDGVNLPPVTLCKVGDAYFVIDGNHRVSVARRRGHQFVDARVTEAQARVPVSADLDAADLVIKGEHTRFLNRTRLNVLRPDQQVELTSAGAYERLLEHIAAHRYTMTVEQQRPIPEDEAVCDWYDHTYLPLVRIIREREILDQFPGRTEADLVLWIMDHQLDLLELCGPGVGTERAAEHFAGWYAAHPVKRMLRTIRDRVAGPVCDLTDDGEKHPGDTERAEKIWRL